MQLAVEDNRKDFCAVLSLSCAYSTQVLSALWLYGYRYWSQQWLEKWINSLAVSMAGADHSSTRLKANA